MSKSITIYKKFGVAIKKDYREGVTIDKLREKEYYDEYEGCSYNTMMIVLGMLGFPSTPYFKKQIDAKLKYIKEDKARRTAR